MSIGDDWFIKSMIVNTLHRTEQLKPRITASQNEVERDFVTILNQLLLEKSQNLPTPLDSINLNSLDPFIGINTNNSNLGDSLRFQPTNAEKLNQSLDGKLRGMGEIFIREGRRYNVDPAFLAAVAQHETGNGKSNAAIEKNNIAGMMGANGLKSYSSVEASIIDMARNLSNNYLEKGFITIPKVGAKYAPVGASNDPTGLNNHWVSGVSNYYNQLTDN
jgi:beta-N-acetylglucosaminidase